jgi:hypothetical protein
VKDSFGLQLAELSVKYRGTKGDKLFSNETQSIYGFFIAAADGSQREHKITARDRETVLKQRR